MDRDSASWIEDLRRLLFDTSHEAPAANPSSSTLRQQPTVSQPPEDDTPFALAPPGQVRNELQICDRRPSDGQHQSIRFVLPSSMGLPATSAHAPTPDIDSLTQHDHFASGEWSPFQHASLPSPPNLSPPEILRSVFDDPHNPPRRASSPGLADIPEPQRCRRTTWHHPSETSEIESSDLMAHRNRNIFDIQQQASDMNDFYRELSVMSMPNLWQRPQGTPPLPARPKSFSMYRSRCDSAPTVVTGTPSSVWNTCISDATDNRIDILTGAELKKDPYLGAGNVDAIGTGGQPGGMNTTIITVAKPSATYMLRKDDIVGESAGSMFVASKPFPGRRRSSSSPGRERREECQVSTCRADISKSRPYNRRYKLCEACIHLSSVVLNGKEMRFCQQCSCLHNIAEFDGKKKSCRARLNKHKARRRERFTHRPHENASDNNAVEDRNT